jgi:hypothetical protein
MVKSFKKSLLLVLGTLKSVYVEILSVILITILVLSFAMLLIVSIDALKKEIGTRWTKKMIEKIW